MPLLYPFAWRAGARHCGNTAGMRVLYRGVGLLLIHVLGMWPSSLNAGCYSDPPVADHHLLPPQLVENAPLPNVLIILDNSNSMDEALDGEPVGSFSDESRSEIARRALRRVIDRYGGQMRIGLMSFRLGDDVAASHLHSLLLYASYDETSYGSDKPYTPRDPSSNTRRRHNSSYSDEAAPYEDGDHFVYYDQATANYMPFRAVDQFCYSTHFSYRQDEPTPIESIACAENWYDAHICRDNPYYCHPSKTGLRDIQADGAYDPATDQPAIDEYGGPALRREFRLTDSDVARGMYQIGAQVAMVYVGGAWSSPTSPGGGDLVVEISDPGAARDAELASRLARVDKFTTPYDMARTAAQRLPIRNAGLTPLATTLMSAKDYFAGAADRNRPQVQYRSPIVAPCQKNFVVLVTDGLPTEKRVGDGDAIAPAVEAAAALRRTPLELGGEAYTFDIQTFVLGFALSTQAGQALDPIAVAGGTDIDGRAYLAGDEEQLAVAFQGLLKEIRTRTASGSAATALPLSRSGEGAVYQAVFHSAMSDGKREIRWAGDVRGLFLDRGGRLHESAPDADGGQTLEDPVTFPETGGDAFVTTCYDEAYQTLRVNKAFAASDLPSEVQVQQCGRGVFNAFFEDIQWLWSGGEWLAGVADAVNQRPYEEAQSRRYIFTGIDAVGGDGQVSADEQRPFLSSSFSDSISGLLQADDGAAAETFVNYIRGVDQPGMRPRLIDHDQDGVTETWRLGDIVNGTPVAVQRPAENLDLLYGDESYRKFAVAYRNRRVVVYAGANDGMLHAFNGGWYDAAGKAFRKADAESGATPFDLGAELWAYVPYNLLPHLRYIADPDYGRRDGDHLFFVDLPPVVFDARIFGPMGVSGQPGVDHPGGWGTVLVGGTGFGGRETIVEANPASPGSDVRRLRPSIFIIDVTDPEHPPVLMLEFSHPELGFTIARPTPVVAGGDWYLMLGSGPYPADSSALAQAGSTQYGKLFLLDLKKMALAEAFGEQGVLTFDAPDSFVSDLVAVDYGIGGQVYSTDAVYFGTVSGDSDGGWSGELMRVRICDDDNPDEALSLDQWKASTLIDTGVPMSGAPTVALDELGNRWIFAGSGRYFTAADAADVSRQYVCGVKEPSRPAAGQSKVFTWETVAMDDIEDVTAVELYAGEAQSRNEFDDLKTAIEENRAGWRLQLGQDGERCLEQPALLGDMMVFNTFVPSAAPCTAGGNSSLYSLFYTTGSAYFEPVIGSEADAAGGTEQQRQRILKKKKLGPGIAASPNLVRGEGDAVKAVVQSGSGNLALMEMLLPGVTKSRPLYWDLWAP